jgi:hypothetical protein
MTLQKTVWLKWFPPLSYGCWMLVTCTAKINLLSKPKQVIKLKLSQYTPWRRLGGEEVIYLPLILYLGTRWGWLVRVVPRSRPTPRERTPVPIVQEAGWATELVWTQRLEEKSFCLCPGSNLDRPVVQSVARHNTDWATLAHKASNSRADIGLILSELKYETSYQQGEMPTCETLQFCDWFPWPHCGPFADAQLVLVTERLGRLF